MYVRPGKFGRMRGLARAHGVSGLRGLRGARLSGLGDDIDWSQIIDTGISTAGSVAQVALKPPTYSSVVYPSGASSVTSYGAVPSTSALGTSTTSLLSSPYLILGGLALLAVVLMKQ